MFFFGERYVGTKRRPKKHDHPDVTILAQTAFRENRLMFMDEKFKFIVANMEPFLWSFTS